MSAENQALDPYEAVLADLRAKRDQLDIAIKAIEATRGGAATAPALTSSSQPASGIEGPGAFLGLSIVDAAKRLLAAKRQPLRNPEFAAAFKVGGLHLNSNDPVNTIGAVLTRRANEVGDIVKIGRGTFGLKEWYPNRSFKKGKAEEDKSGPTNANDDLV